MGPLVNDVAMFSFFSRGSPPTGTEPKRVYRATRAIRARHFIEPVQHVACHRARCAPEALPIPNPLLWVPRFVGPVRAAEDR